MENVELKDGRLTIVFDMNEKRDGKEYVAPTVNVYVGKQKIGMLRNFRFEVRENEPFPEVEFDFGRRSYDSVIPGWIDILKGHLNSIAQNFPWANWKSPIGDSKNEQPIHVPGPGRPRWF